MGDRYYQGHGHPRPRYNDERGGRRGRDDRYEYDDRPGRYESYSRYDRPRSRSPPRRGYDRFDDRYNSRGDGYRRDDEYSFRGAADRGGRGQSYRSEVPQSEFTFRTPGPPAPQFPRWRRSPAPIPEPAPARTKNSRRDQGRRAPNGQLGARGHDAGPRGRFRKPPPHQREILRRQNGGSTPEQLHGMNQDGQARFNEANFSSSDEEGSEDGEIDDSAMDEGDGPRKRVKADVTVTESAGQAAPKWSNPEYFTALPPPESSGGPKKDIVQVIRKAKIEQAAKQDTSNAVKDNADFISFNMEDGDSDSESDGGIRLHSMKLSDNDAAKKAAPPTYPTPAATQSENTFEPEAEEEPAPKRRPFKQFVRPRSPFKSFNLPRINKPKDPDAPPPQPPPGIDALMSTADRMRSPKQPAVKVKIKPQQSPEPMSIADNLRLSKQPLVETEPQQSSEPMSMLDRIQSQKHHAANTMPQQSSGRVGKKRKAAQISKGLGDIVTEWQTNGTNPTPWCTVDHTQTANVGFRLHKEIADFYEFVRPHDYEEAVRRDLIDRVQRVVRTYRNDNASLVEIRSFGSFASGVYLPTADMDLVAVSSAYLNTGRKSFCQTSSKLHKLGFHLVSQNVAVQGTMQVVAKAKVPIIKFVEKQTGIKVDISFENDTGLIALKTFAEWKEKYPAMSVIVVLIKQMLAMRGLNEVYLGGLGGFSIICLVVSMMQHMPEIQSCNMPPELHYSDLLLNFLDLYGNKFNLQSTGITMNPPGYFDKLRYPHKRQNDNGLTIIDPNKPDNDISGGSSKIKIVFECFRTAHAEIQRRLYQIHSGENVEDSILGCVLAGNYTSFTQQRNRLSMLHRGQAMDPIPVGEHEDPRPPKAKPPKKNTRSKGPTALAFTRAKHPLPQRPPPKSGYNTRYEDPPTNKKNELEIDLDGDDQETLKEWFPDPAAEDQRYGYV